MLLTLDDMVTLLRSSVNVQYDDAGDIDPKYLAMSDDDIKLFIKWGVSHAFPEVTSLEELEEGCEYPILLLAKIELYNKLASLYAVKVDLNADNANSIKLGDRFQHYKALADAARQEYEDWLENESIGANQVNSYDVLLSNRHYTHRNYELAPTPKVRISVDSVTTDCVEIHWKFYNISHFGKVRVYISKDQIVDPYANGSHAEDKVSDTAILVKTTSDLRNNTHRVEGLDADTLYHIAVFEIERNSVYGYNETTFRTLEPFEEDEEVDITTL